MTSHILPTALLSTLLLLSAPAFAIYKCESNGKVSYSDQSCPGGTQVKTDAGLPVDADAAKLQLAEDKKTIKQLEHQRHQREAQQEKENKKAALAYTSKQKKCTSLALRSKWAQEDATSGSLKTIDKQKRKARRAEEKYAMECGT